MCRGWESVEKWMWKYLLFIWFSIDSGESIRYFFYDLENFFFKVLKGLFFVRYIVFFLGFWLNDFD